MTHGFSRQATKLAVTNQLIHVRTTPCLFGIQTRLHYHDEDPETGELYRLLQDGSVRYPEAQREYWYDEQGPSYGSDWKGL